MHLEKRQDPRVPRSLAVSVERASLVKVPGEPAVEGRVLDVSRRGVSFVAPCSYPRDARLRLRVRIEPAHATAIETGPRALLVEGTVRQSLRVGDGPDYRTGVQLPDRAAGDSLPWQDLVRRWTERLL